MYRCKFEKKKKKVVAKIFIYRIYKEFLMKVYFIQVPSKIYVHVNKVYRVLKLSENMIICVPM